jgi:hypothetical protein
MLTLPLFVARAAANGLPAIEMSTIDKPAGNPAVPASRFVNCETPPVGHIGRVPTGGPLIGDGNRLALDRFCWMKRDFEHAVLQFCRDLLGVDFLRQRNHPGK